MTMRKKGLATAVLAATAAGAAGFGWLSSATGGFWPGLLAHGFLAGTIGGLADWFAVTAIFRKPLGISYRTDILRRSRPRIMHALAEFAGRDLLGRAHIMEHLAKQDFSGMLAAYLTERGGRQRLAALLDAVFLRGMETLPMRRVAEVLEPPIRRTFSELELPKLAGRAYEAALLPETRHQLLRVLVPVARQVWSDSEWQAILLAAIGNIRETYVGDQSMRATLFEMEELSEERLLARLNDYAEAWLDALMRGEGDAYTQLCGRLDDFLQDEGQRERFMAAVKKWQQDTVRDADISEWLTRGLERLRENCLLSWRQALRGWLDSRIDAFLADADARGRFNARVLQWIDDLLAKHHDELPEMMERQLARLSDDEMVELVETRVEDDLQMIRVNGAVVGALVGMLLYVLTIAAERMWI